jgi:hypothetical protein
MPILLLVVRFANVLLLFLLPNIFLFALYLLHRSCFITITISSHWITRRLNLNFELKIILSDTCTEHSCCTVIIKSFAISACILLTLLKSASTGCFIGLIQFICSKFSCLTLIMFLYFRMY